MKIERTAWVEEIQVKTSHTTRYVGGDIARRVPVEYEVQMRMSSGDDMLTITLPTIPAGLAAQLSKPLDAAAAGVKVTIEFPDEDGD